MTIPKKDSRISDVDGVQYRWIVSRQAFDSEVVLLTFLAHVERDSAGRHTPQSKLQVVFHESHCNAVTPALAVSFIRQSIRDGWDPNGLKAHFVNPHAALRLIAGASV